MIKLVTREEMRRIEHAANEAGLGYDVMMENAGRSAAAAIAERQDKASAQILILVGPGNNGGDGLVVARCLYEWGYPVTVYIWKRSVPDDPNLSKAQALEIPILWAVDDSEFAQLKVLVRDCTLLVDAMLGTGATGPLRGTLRDLIGQIQDSLSKAASQQEARPQLQRIRGLPSPNGSPHRPTIVAIDLPSGLDANTGEIDDLALKADLTVTFAYPKPGQFLYPGAAHVGELFVADIGLDPSLAALCRVLAADIPDAIATPADIADMLPKRPLDAHKGTFGKAMIVAGSTHYVGAPCLAAEAACRSGAGLVTLAIPQGIYSVVAAKVSEPTFLVLPHDMGVLVPEALRVLAERLAGYNVLLVGPGLGRELVTGDFMRALLTGETHRGTKPVGFASQSTLRARPQLPPLVLDADGLNLTASLPTWWRYLPAGSVLTPHPGEMARLLDCDRKEIAADRIGVARGAAQDWGCTIILKGANTVVASADGRITIIPFANPALATGGTGDVLAGAVTGLMAQGLSGYDAAICGAYIHGLAAQIWSQCHGASGLLASDLLPLLPQAMDKMRALRDE